MIMQASRRKMFFTEDYEPIKKKNSRGKLREPGSKTLKNMIQDATYKQA